MAGLAKYVIEHLKGIAEEDLTTAERQILARAKEELKPRRCTCEQSKNLSCKLHNQK